MTTPPTYVRYVLTSGTVATPVFSYGTIELIEALNLTHAEQLVISLNDTVLTLTTDFTVNEGTEQITIVGTTAAGLAVDDVLVIQRETKIDEAYVDFENNSTVDADDLDANNQQLLFLIQELEEQSGNSITLDLVNDCWDAQSKKICNLADGTADTDAVNLRQLLSAVEGAETGTVDNVGFWNFTGDGVETAFTLTGAGIGYTLDRNVMVFVASAYQRPTTSYTLSAGDTPNPIVTFDEAPPSGATIYVLTFYGLVKAVLQTEIIDGGSLAPDSVELDAINFGSGVDKRFIVLDTSGDPTLRVAVHTDISDFDAGVVTNRLDQMAAPTASVSMNTQKITSLLAGTSSTDAVNKAQMDAAISAAVGTKDVAAVSTTAVGSVVPTGTTGLTGTNGSSNAALYTFQFTSVSSSGTDRITLSVKTSSGSYVDLASFGGFSGTATMAYATLQGFVPAGGGWKITKSGTGVSGTLTSYSTQVLS